MFFVPTKSLAWTWRRVSVYDWNEMTTFSSPSLRDTVYFVYFMFLFVFYLVFFFHFIFFFRIDYFARNVNWYPKFALTLWPITSKRIFTQAKGPSTLRSMIVNQIWIYYETEKDPTWIKSKPTIFFVLKRIDNMRTHRPMEFNLPPDSIRLL